MSSEAIALRVVRPEDAAAIAQLRERSGWKGGAGEERMRRYFAGEHHPRHALAERVGFVAESDARPVGFVAGHRTTRLDCEGELQWLLVAPELRGSGLASGLLRALGNWFGEQGIRRVCANVEPDNERARAFYRRHGAREYETHWMIWEDLPATTSGAPCVPGPEAHGAASARQSELPER